MLVGILKKCLNAERDLFFLTKKRFSKVTLQIISRDCGDLTRSDTTLPGVHIHLNSYLLAAKTGWFEPIVTTLYHGL